MLICVGSLLMLTNTTFDEARGLLLDELKGQAGDYGMLAMGLVDARRGRVWEHLERKLSLRKLEERPSPIIAKEREQKFKILLSARQAERAPLQPW